MKTNSIYIIIAIFLSLAACDVAPVDPDPKPEPGDLGGGNFDSWVVINQGAVSYDNPAFNWWTTLNPLATIGGPVTVTKTADSKAGPFGARLETKLWGTGFIIPGMLVSGVFDQTRPPGSNVLIGRPFTKKPKTFTGYYKYLPQSNDSCGFLVALTKYNPSLGVKDTVAVANFTRSGTVPNYTFFSVDFNYRNTFTPDSIHVVVISSAAGNGLQGNPGSVLFVDELELKFD